MQKGAGKFCMCGKEITTYGYYPYCSDKCKKVFDKVECKYCRSKYTTILGYSEEYCSEECAEAADAIQVADEGICPNCFTRPIEKGGTYCYECNAALHVVYLKNTSDWNEEYNDECPEVIRTLVDLVTYYMQQTEVQKDRLKDIQQMVRAENSKTVRGIPISPDQMLTHLRNRLAEWL